MKAVNLQSHLFVKCSSRAFLIPYFSKESISNCMTMHFYLNQNLMKNAKSRPWYCGLLLHKTMKLFSRMMLNNYFLSSGHNSDCVVCMGYAANRRWRAWWRSILSTMETKRNAATGFPSTHLEINQVLYVLNWFSRGSVHRQSVPFQFHLLLRHSLHIQMRPTSDVFGWNFSHAYVLEERVFFFSTIPPITWR